MIQAHSLLIIILVRENLIGLDIMYQVSLVKNILNLNKNLMFENLEKGVCRCQMVDYTCSAKSRKGSWIGENVLAAMSMMTWDIQQLVAWCPLL